MSSPEAFDALEAFITTNWTTTPVVFENEDWPLDTADPAAFLYVEIFGNLFAQASVGDPGHNLWRESGTLQAHFMVPNQTGTRAARQYAKAFADLFRETTVDGVRFDEISLGAGEPGRPTGNYFPFTVTVDWERDEN